MSGALFIALGIFCLIQEIVNGYLVKIGQLYQYIRGDIPLTKFVVAVDLLRAIQKLCNLSLREIPIFPQITYSLVHGITSKEIIPYCVLLY